MPISLKPHNIEPYQKVTEKMKESNRVAVIHPTGTGKMFIALKLLEENKDKRAIYVAPSNPILHDVKKNIFAEGMTMQDFPNLKRITYQKLKNLSVEEIEKLEADIIILDEFHHCGAPEWGKGVDRLIERNPNIKILGLSATPLRYFDGLRDMADELFENNVASEMSLEEAIEKGILPEATYVSTLYGYDKELENMQSNIDKIKNKEKKEHAQDLLNSLREKLDENTQNLPELFSEHMKNKNGKYIVFCKNIDDMNEKVEQAQKMFGKVNPNITVRAVSSKIKESDKILTEFEQDTDEGTLKLLYAVDMINEGYHVIGLDGVIMMRPTYSPAIYTQQLGRALTVGGDKKPVILDLVNNFDSCKIIEDFAERMKEYKGHEGLERADRVKRNRISIFDKTKEFREIAEKITELSARRKISLEEKIQIFEKFSETREELVGNTTFEGYPIGHWAIQIRNGLNRINSGKEEKQTINPTKEQLERLEILGILERQIDSTIDEKIDALVEWRAKYPKAKMARVNVNEILGEYAKTEKERQQIVKEYEKIRRYYDYVRVRKSQNKLEDEQIKKCKEGNVGGVFGYPTEIEELAKKYGKTEKEIDYIFSNYGTIENFYNLYRSKELKNESDVELAGSFIKDVFDIDGINNPGCESLVKEILSIKDRSLGVILYSNKSLMESLDELELIEKKILVRRYDLIGDESSRSLEDIGDELYRSPLRENQIKRKAERKLSRIVREKKLYTRLDALKNNNLLTEAEREKLAEIENDISLSNNDLTNEEVKKRFEFVNLIREEITQREKREREKEKEKEKEIKNIKIEDVFSVRTSSLLSRANLVSLGDISNLTLEELKKIRGLGFRSFDDIISKLEESGLHLREENKEEQLQEIVSQDQGTIESNEEALKQELLQKILEQQKIIAEQQSEIDRLKNLKTKQ